MRWKIIIPVLLGLALLFLVYLVKDGSLLLSKTFVHPQTDFLVIDNFGDALQKNFDPKIAAIPYYYSVQNGKLVRTQNPNWRAGNTTLPSKLYRYNVKANRAVEVSFPEATSYVLDTDEISPDGYHYAGDGGTDYLFKDCYIILCFGGYVPPHFQLIKGSFLHAELDPSNLAGSAFIGWVISSPEKTNTAVGANTAPANPADEEITFWTCQNRTYGFEFTCPSNYDVVENSTKDIMELVKKNGQKGAKLTVEKTDIKDLQKFGEFVYQSEIEKRGKLPIESANYGVGESSTVINKIPVEISVHTFFDQFNKPERTENVFYFFIPSRSIFIRVENASDVDRVVYSLKSIAGDY